MNRRAPRGRKRNQPAKKASGGLIAAVVIVGAAALGIGLFVLSGNNTLTQAEAEREIEKINQDAAERTAENVEAETKRRMRVYLAQGMPPEECQIGGSLYTTTKQQVEREFALISRGGRVAIKLAKERSGEQAAYVLAWELALKANNKDLLKTAGWSETPMREEMIRQLILDRLPQAQAQIELR